MLPCVRMCVGVCVCVRPWWGFANCAWLEWRRSVLASVVLAADGRTLSRAFHAADISSHIAYRIDYTPSNDWSRNNININIHIHFQILYPCPSTTATTTTRRASRRRRATRAFNKFARLSLWTRALKVSLFIAWSRVAHRECFTVPLPLHPTLLPRPFSICTHTHTNLPPPCPRTTPIRFAMCVAWSTMAAASSWAGLALLLSLSIFPLSLRFECGGDWL